MYNVYLINSVILTFTSTAHSYYQGVKFGSGDTPVNIISVTALVEQLDNDSGIWIQTSRHASIFTWYFKNYTTTIVHPASRLPQLQMNNDYSKLTSFCNFLENAGLVPRSQDAVFLCGFTRYCK